MVTEVGARGDTANEMTITELRADISERNRRLDALLEGSRRARETVLEVERRVRENQMENRRLGQGLEEIFREVRGLLDQPARPVQPAQPTRSAQPARPAQQALRRSIREDISEINRRLDHLRRLFEEI